MGNKREKLDWDDSDPTGSEATKNGVRYIVWADGKMFNGKRVTYHESVGHAKAYAEHLASETSP